MSNEKVLGALHRTRAAIDDLDWSLDGYNDKQGYRFLSHRKMKANMNKALLTANAEFIVSYDSYEMKEPIGMMKQHYVIEATGTFFDVESGESLVFKAFGEAADSGDKAIGKAQTNAYKSLIAQTFQISELNEDGESIISSNDSVKTDAKSSFEAKAEIVKDKVIRQNAVPDPVEKPAKEGPSKRTDISATQQKILEKIISKARILDEGALASFGGLDNIESDYVGVKTSEDALNFITAYKGVLECQ